MAKKQRLYNYDRTGYLEFIIGEYDNSYDGTSSFNLRLLTEPQVRDITTYDRDGDPNNYTVVTYGTESPAHIIGYDGNIMTNEVLQEFFKQTTLDIFDLSTFEYDIIVDGATNGYPFVKITKVITPQGNPLIDIDLVVGPRTYGHYALIGLLNNYNPKVTLINGYGYQQINIATDIYLGLPCSLGNLAQIISDMGSDRQLRLESATGQIGKWTSSLYASELKDNSDNTIGNLALRWYYNLESGNIIYNTAIAYISQDVIDLLKNLDEEDVENDDGTYNDGDGESGTGDGPESLPDGDTIDRITIPTLSPLSLGVYNLYKMTVQQFQAFKSNLWNATVMDYLTKIWQSDPMDSILTVALAPFTPAVSTDTPIYIGGQTIPNATGSPLVESYVYHVFNLNYSRKIGEVWGNKYDYDGVSYTLFVPFVGFQKLTVNDIYHKSLELNYIIETLTGNGICYLYTKPGDGNFDTKEKSRPTYTWSFNCYSKIPLSGRNLDNFVTSIIGGVGSAMSGNLGGVTTLATARPTIERSGELKPNSGYMGGRRPYIVCEYSNLFIKNGQYSKQGRPAWRYSKLDNCTGFTKCKDAKVECSNFMSQEEASEINQLLNEGVIL